ncbi:TetR/AcrR family transcriptional regulator [Actinoplanes aureus]|uniref:Helix-turn-helix transcriptional regulator n=1 Tax=Actinoplanes aureus TaxID=2792083 RepID=A0A931CHB7_9ACTN|nr:TetR/AcrR family transcriptional regulator [Actinoplanes aureus]MBG0566471.1 helix-turn-helix transcriptional regulator [Actinoplanes aureus]
MPQQSLSPALIVDTAMDILDHEGVASLSMRAIAARLDVKAASLYYHVRNKDSVLQAIADRVAGEVNADIDPDTSWRPMLTAMAARLRAILRAHPGVTAVVATKNVSPQVAQQIADRLGPSLAGGLNTTMDRALLLAQSLYVLVAGLALAEFGDVPHEPVAPRAYYDAWFDLAVGTFLDGIDTP